MPYRNGIQVGWKYHVRIKHLFKPTRDDESPETVKEVNNAIYAVLKQEKCFKDFEMLDYFKDQDDLDEANGLLDDMYDYADANLIWIE